MKTNSFSTDTVNPGRVVALKTPPITVLMIIMTLFAWGAYADDTDQSEWGYGAPVFPNDYDDWEDAARLRSFASTDVRLQVEDGVIPCEQVEIEEKFDFPGGFCTGMVMALLEYMNVEEPAGNRASVVDAMKRFLDRVRLGPNHDETLRNKMFKIQTESDNLFHNPKFSSFLANIGVIVADYFASINMTPVAPPGTNYVDLLFERNLWRIELGYRKWNPLWEYVQPDETVFTLPDGTPWQPRVGDPIQGDQLLMSNFRTQSIHTLNQFLRDIEATFAGMPSDRIAQGFISSRFTSTLVTREVRGSTGPNDTIDLSSMENEGGHSTYLIRTAQDIDTGAYTWIYVDPNLGAFIYDSFEDFAQAIRRAYGTPYYIQGKTLPESTIDNVEQFTFINDFIVLAPRVEKNNDARTIPDPVITVSTPVNATVSAEICNPWEVSTSRQHKNCFYPEATKLPIYFVDKTDLETHSKSNCGKNGCIAADSNDPSLSNWKQKYCLTAKPTFNLDTNFPNSQGYNINYEPCDNLRDLGTVFKDDDYFRIDEFYYTPSGQIVAVVLNYYSEKKGEVSFSGKGKNTDIKHFFCLTDNSYHDKKKNKTQFRFELTLCDATLLGQRWEFVLDAKYSNEALDEKNYRLISGLNHSLGYIGIKNGHHIHDDYYTFLFSQNNVNKIQRHVTSQSLYQYALPLVPKKQSQKREDVIKKGKVVKGVEMRAKSHEVWDHDVKYGANKGNKSILYYNKHSKRIFFFDQQLQVAHCFHSKKPESESWEWLSTKANCQTAELQGDDNARWVVVHKGEKDALSIYMNGDREQGRIEVTSSGWWKDYLFVAHGDYESPSHPDEFFGIEHIKDKTKAYDKPYGVDFEAGRYGDGAFDKGHDFIPLRPRLFDFFDIEKPRPVFLHDKYDAPADSIGKRAYSNREGL